MTQKGQVRCGGVEEGTARRGRKQRKGRRRRREEEERGRTYYVYFEYCDARIHFIHILTRAFYPSKIQAVRTSILVAYYGSGGEGGARGAPLHALSYSYCPRRARWECVKRGPISFHLSPTRSASLTRNSDPRPCGTEPPSELLRVRVIGRPTGKISSREKEQVQWPGYLSEGSAQIDAY